MAIFWQKGQVWEIIWFLCYDPKLNVFIYFSNLVHSKFLIFCMHLTERHLSTSINVTILNLKSSFLDDIDIQNWNAHEYENTDAELNEFLWRLDACVEPHAPLKKLKQKIKLKEMKIHGLTIK